MIELVVVIVIVGILAIFVAPRFFDADAFKTRGFADQVQATLRYAQRVAIAQRHGVCAVYTAPGRLSLSATASVACDTPMDIPAAGVNYVEAPGGVAFSMTPASIRFDALGRPDAGAVASIGTYAITVEAETGYVHR